MPRPPFFLGSRVCFLTRRSSQAITPTSDFPNFANLSTKPLAFLRLCSHIPLASRMSGRKCPPWAFPPLTWGRLTAASFLFRGLAWAQACEDVSGSASPIPSVFPRHGLALASRSISRIARVVVLCGPKRASELLSRLCLAIEALAIFDCPRTPPMTA